MQILNQLFLKIIEMSVLASFIIVFVLIIRFLLKGFPKSYTYILWGVVAFRLIIPSSVSSNISVLNVSVNWFAAIESEQKTVTPESMNLYNSFIGESTQGLEPTIDSHINKSGPILNYEPSQQEKDFSEESNGTKAWHVKTIDVFVYIWLTGILMLVFYSIVSAIKIKNKLKYSIKLYNNVYECDGIRSPFIFGMLRPKIYIPFRLSKEQQQCILLHEEYHIKRKDYLVKIFASFLTIIYWFHPLVWISYYLMCCDMEMSCDEKVISELNFDMKKEYSRLLLAFAANKRQQTANMLAFGKEHTMKRIKNIMSYQKPQKWKTLAGATVLIITMAACATDAQENHDISTVAEKTDITENDNKTNTIQAEITSDTKKESTDLIAHQPAQWAQNSMFDLELCTLDYADENKIVFHISSGLFAYSLNENRIMTSLDLQALNCQEVQTGGPCKIEVYTAGENGLKAVIAPYPYKDEGKYLYHFDTDELIMYDNAALEGYEPFIHLVSKYDLENLDEIGISDSIWKISEKVVEFGNNTYGVLHYDDIHLNTMKYTMNEETWELFDAGQATQPNLMKQDDSFYESFAAYCGQNLAQCIVEYTGFYRAHDYAGICALSTDLEYSDEKQQEWLTHKDMLSGGTEISHSETECTYQFVQSEDFEGNEGQVVTVTFVYIEGEGWRAKGLPVPSEQVLVPIS